MRSPSSSESIPLAILPGLDGSAKLAQPLVDRLPPHILPIPLDLPAREFHPGDLLEQLAQRLPQDRPVYLLAQSFTTPLGMELARLHRVSGLILVCPLFRRGRPGLSNLLRIVPSPLLGIRPPRFAVRWLLFRPGISPDLLDTFEASVNSLPASDLAARLRQLGRLLEAKGSPALPAPTLCLHARQDRLLTGPIPRTNAPHVRHRVLPGPHCLLVQHPDAVTAEVVRFVMTNEQLRAGPPSG